MIKLIFFCRFVFFIGPVVAEAMFLNREEIPVFPAYRDPVSKLFLRFLLLLGSSNYFIHFLYEFFLKEDSFVCEFV